MRIQRLFYAFALGVGLTLGLLALLQTAYAAPDDLFAAPSGSDTGCTQAHPCALQTALSQASDSDTIYVAQGIYTGTGAAVISVTKSITLYGGWDGAPSGTVVRDPSAYVTVLDGENARRVAYITGTVSPILEGLTLQKGNASGLGGDPMLPNVDFGGAIYSNNASPVITNCRILSSTAGMGGGLALYYGAPNLGNSTVRSNTANQDVLGTVRGIGGGIFLYQSPATIVGNVVITNVATGTDLTFDGGGGLYLDGSAAAILSNTIEDNYGSPNGGGLYIGQSKALIRGNIIQANNATAQGGGVLMWLGSSALEANTVLGNRASNQGGGLFVSGSAPFTLTNNVVAWNVAGGGAGALSVAGYEPLMGPGQYSQGSLLHNTFVENHSSVPWMIHVGLGPGPGRPTTTLVFTNTLFGLPGGVYVDYNGSATLDTTLWDLAYQGDWLTAITGPGVIVSRTNLYGNPGFVGSTCHIGSLSAAIDQGANAGVTTDVDGESRPNGAGYDIGADEFYCHPLTKVTIAGPTMGISGTAHTFTATVAPETASLPITYTWQATGQMPVANTVYSISDTAVFTWAVAGDHTITATAVNCSGSIFSDTHAVAVKWYIYLPLVVKNYAP